MKTTTTSPHEVKMTGWPETGATMTSLQGYFNPGTSYADLCKVFGKPNCETDGYKVDAEWAGTINGHFFTIYNYKTGKNYNGASGLPLSKITDWHIGGESKAVLALVEHFTKSPRTSKKAQRQALTGRDIRSTVALGRHRAKDKDALVFDPTASGADFILEGSDAWITVDGVSVWVRRAGRAVSVELYRKGQEASHGPIDTAQAVL